MTQIAHSIAKHSSERLSLYYFVETVSALLQFFVFGDLSQNKFVRYAKDLFLYLPHSRLNENEADTIGIKLMAHSCFDPHAAISLWEKMNAVVDKKNFQLVSTHPTSKQRITNLTRQLPEAMAIFKQSGCFDKNSFFRLKNLI